MKALHLARTTLFAALAGATAMAHAATYAWVDWNSETPASMAGTLTLASGTVEATFSGPLYFGQIGGPDERDYWWSGGPDAYAVTERPRASTSSPSSAAPARRSTR